MDGAVSPIDQLLGMTQGKAGAAAFVPRIGHGGGVTALQSRGERGRGNRPRPAAVSIGLEFPVPARGGEPDLEFDIGIAGWFKRGGYLQNAGSSLKAALGSPPRPPRPFAGTEKAPAATDCARVIVVSGSASEVRLSQVVAAWAGVSTLQKKRRRQGCKR